MSGSVMPVPGYSSTRLTMGALIAAFAALSISVSNVSLPAFYANGGDVQVFLTGRNGASFILAVFFAFAARTWRGKGTTPHRWLSDAEGGAALLSGALYGAGALTVLGSIALIPVTLAILILFTFPVLTVVFQSLIDRRIPAPLQLVFLVIALAGVAVALDVQGGGVNVLGVVMAGMGAVLIAASFVLNERLLSNADGFSSAAVMAFSGLAVVAGFTFATGSFSMPTGAGIPALAIAVAGSSIAFLAMFRAVKIVGATPTAMVMNLEPVFTIALSVWILSEVPSVQRLAGAAMVIGAVVVSQVLAMRASASLARLPTQPSDPRYIADRQPSSR